MIPQSRNGAFQEGLGTTNPVYTFTPNSVLNAFMPSPNGMSAKDAQRRLLGGGMLPTSNARSAGTYEAERPILSNIY